jgi:hypothetical protein
MVLRVPTTIIVPMIFVLCVIGTFALAGRLFDVWTMLLFGVLGFVLRRFHFPVAPLVLGIVLGDLLEKSLRRGLVLSDGDLSPFFTRPISAALFGIIAIVILLRVPAVNRLHHRPARVKLALCNEVLAPRPFAEQCRVAAALGYMGLEVAPYALCDDPAAMTDAEARALARIAADHWPRPLPACTGCWSSLAACRSRPPTRRSHGRTVAFMRRLVRPVRGDGRRLSGARLAQAAPGRRRAQTKSDALARATEAFASRRREQPASAGVTYCIEPLSADQTPLVNTVAEAADIVRAVRIARTCAP